MWGGDLTPPLVTEVVSCFVGIRKLGVFYFVNAHQLEGEVLSLQNLKGTDEYQ